jgi:hypothetical protein
VLAASILKSNDEKEHFKGTVAPLWSGLKVVWLKSLTLGGAAGGFTVNFDSAPSHLI